jgi:hypothetical protein
MFHFSLVTNSAAGYVVDHILLEPQPNEELLDLLISCQNARMPSQATAMKSQQNSFVCLHIVPQPDTPMLAYDAIPQCEAFLIAIGDAQFR